MDVDRYLSDLIEVSIKNKNMGHIPSFDDMVIELSTSPQTLRRRIAGTEYRNYKGFLEYARSLVFTSILDDEFTSPERLAEAMGFKDVASIYRYTREKIGRTPSNVMNSTNGASRKLYVFGFPNGAVKFGISVHPEIRLNDHINNPLSGHEEPIYKCITLYRKDYRDIENRLIDEFRGYSADGTREWLLGVDFKSVQSVLNDALKDDEGVHIDISVKSAKEFYSTLSGQALMAGFSGLEELKTLSRVSESDLREWHRNNPERFDLAVDAALYRRKCNI